MAETAKSRLRTHYYELQPGEHVWVSTTFFDNVKVPLEERYSTIIGGDGESNMAHSEKNVPSGKRCIQRDVSCH